MRIIQTADLTPDSLKSQTERDIVYNGLDCCVTLEVLEALLPQLDNVTTASYQRSLDLQAPILEMNMRGTLIDEAARQEAINAYKADRAKLDANFHRIVKEVYGIEPSKGATVWNSPDKLKELFYERMKLPVRKSRNAQGKYVPTVNREALEHFRSYYHAQPLVNHILPLRDLGKKIGFLSTGIDPDDRIRTSFNIAGTTTYRLASSMSEFGTGTNLQNIERRLRRVFIPDPGFKFANIDLEQADARNVGALIATLFNDYTFLDACESGDLHTTVCKLAWFELPWTGEPKRDREIADQIAYRDLSYRDLSKKLGHGTNFLMQPYTASKNTKLPQNIIVSFNSKYFGAFPYIPKWHDWVRSEIRNTGTLTTLFGRRRHFFGRRSDESTIREAVAFCPQSMTADQINTALLNIWRHAPPSDVHLLIQVHDSILLQYRENKEAELLQQIKSLMGAPLTLPNGRLFDVPHEVKVGWNWADATPDNPQGLVKYNGVDTRKRAATTKVNVLDRVLLRSD